MDDKLIDQLIAHESCIPHAYQDSLGYWTIGIGRLIDPRKGGCLSQEECRYLLRNDIERVKHELDSALPWWRTLDEVRSRVLCDMAFNMGVAGLLAFKNTLALIQAKDYAAAADAMLKSRWATQVKGRATRLAAMMRTGRA
jgi:lysozyme